MKVRVIAPAFMGSRLRIGDIVEVDDDFKASWAEEHVEPEEVDGEESEEGSEEESEEGSDD